MGVRSPLITFYIEAFGHSGLYIVCFKLGEQLLGGGVKTTIIPKMLHTVTLVCVCVFADINSAIVVVLPFSLVLLLFGGICGLVSSLARSPVLLTGTASYFFICSKQSFSRLSLYPDHVELIHFNVCL